MVPCTDTFFPTKHCYCYYCNTELGVPSAFRKCFSIQKNVTFPALLPPPPSISFPLTQHRTTISQTTLQDPWLFEKLRLRPRLVPI